MNHTKIEIGELKNKIYELTNAMEMLNSIILVT